MRLLYGADWHLRSSTPACRKDTDFYERQLIKLQQVVDWANTYKVDHILHGGDFFDSHDPTLRLVHDVMGIMRKANTQDGDSHWFVNPGNHDIFGANTTTMSRTGLGILRQAGVIQTFDKITTLNDLPGGRRPVIRFIPYRLDGVGDAYHFENKDLSHLYIIVNHDMITTHPVPFPHILYEDVKTNADLVLCSHWHSRFDVTSKSGVRFVNSGPLTRQTLHEASQTPCVVYLEIERRSLDVKFWPLPALSSDEVIDKTVSEPSAMEGVAEQFLHRLSTASLEAMDRHQLVKTVGSKHNFGAPIVKNGLDRVQETEKVLEGI